MKHLFTPIYLPLSLNHLERSAYQGNTNKEKIEIFEEKAKILKILEPRK